MKQIGLFFILALMILGSNSYAELADGPRFCLELRRWLSERFHRK